MDSIDRDSPIPLYFQIATALEAAILAGEHQPGDYLPSEKELASRFEVSVITIRGAMTMLIDKALVRRQRGRGTVVCDRSAAATWELGWLGNLITSVPTSTLELLAMGEQKAPDWVARRFGVPTGSGVHFMRTVRRAVHRSDETFMTTDLYHPPEIGRVLGKLDFETPQAQAKLVIATVEEKCNTTVSSVRQTMGAEIVDRRTRSLLRVAAGSPVLVVTRDYFDTDGKLVQTGRSRYRTDSYEYVLNIARASGHASIGPDGKADHGKAAPAIDGK